MNEFSSSLIINTREYGFFSSYYQILDNIKYCEIHNIKPIINIGDKFLYQNNNSNPWEEFFEPINDSVIEGNAVTITDLTQNANFLLVDFLMQNPTIRDYTLKLYNLLGNEAELRKHREEIHKMMQKYCIVKKQIQQQIADFYNEYKLNEDYLGVHIRSTDYSFSGIERFISYIRNDNLHEKYNKIFVASDRQDNIDRLREEFSNITYYDTSLRSPNGSCSPVCHVMSGDDKIQHGKDLLVEVHLLAGCKEIVCLNSNVAAAACYINPESKIHLIERVHGGA